MSWRALYSPDTGRALYSPDTDRALFSSKFVLSGATRYYTDHTYQLDGEHTRADVYPAGYDDMGFDNWDTAVSVAGMTYWNYNTSSAGKTTYFNQVGAMRYTTTAYKGKTLTGVWRKLDVGDWSKPSGSGSPMFGVRTTSATTPTDGPSWVEDCAQAEFNNPAVNRWSKLRTSLVLDDYLWVIHFVNAGEPPTSQGDNTSTFAGVNTASGLTWAFIV